MRAVAELKVEGPSATVTYEEPYAANPRHVDDLELDAVRVEEDGVVAGDVGAPAAAIDRGADGHEPSVPFVDNRLVTTPSSATWCNPTR